MKQGTQSQGSETTQRDGVGREVEGGGRGVQDGETHVYLWLILSMDSKNHNIVKKLASVSSSISSYIHFLLS